MKRLRCGLRVRLLLVLGFLLAVGLLVPGGASAGVMTWTALPVSEPGFGPSRPDVYGDLVTWGAPLEGVPATWLRYVTSPRILVIPGETYEPCVGRGVVVAESGDLNRDIVSYWLRDFPHLVPHVEADSAANEAQASTDGRWCAFMRYDGQDYEIVAKPVGGAPTIQLTNNAVSDSGPVLAGDFVTWLQGPAPFSVMLHSLRDGWTTTLASGVGYKAHPSTDGRYVVWGQSDGNDMEIMVLDTADYLITQLTDNNVDDYAPVVSGFRVAWVESTATGSHILVCDRRTKTVFDVSGNAETDTNPRISGPRVVWERRESHGPPETTRIWRVDFSQFLDVPATDPNFFAIQSLADDGSVGGYGNGTYGPATSLLRAQFAKIIVVALGYQVDESAWDPAAPPFNDLGPDDSGDLYPHDYVAVAAAEGITVGTGGGAFSPWNVLSRAQMVTLTMRAVGKRYGQMRALPAGYQGTFGDFDPTHAIHMKVAEYLGLTDGIVDFGPTWDPWAPATRAEMAQLVWAARDKFAGWFVLND